LDVRRPLTSGSIRTSSSELQDLDNMGVAVENVLLSSVQAEIKVLSHLPPINDRHL